MTKHDIANWQQTLPEEWTITVTGENGADREIPLRDHPALKAYATKDEAVKALVHAQKLLGKTPEGYVRMPGKDDAPEQVAAFHAALGRPESPAQYALPAMDLPKGFEVRQDTIDEFLDTAHGLGLTTDQVYGLYEWFLPLVLDAHHAIEARAAQERESELQTLRAVHRGDTPRMLDTALRAAEALGGSELLRALDATRAGDKAAVISAFAKVAPLVLESGLRGAASGWGEELSRDTLREMMRDPRYHDPLKREEGFVKKVRDGFKTLYPGDYVPGSRA